MIEGFHHFDRIIKFVGILPGMIRFAPIREKDAILAEAPQGQIDFDGLIPGDGAGEGTDDDR